nr:L-serine ammonia-lyase, iron-sulfur-dependent subunit beta [uncultured Oscillibacter sp.]
MKGYRVFDIIGPRMIGPSSSHTAGAVRLGGVACRLVGGDVVRATVTLYGSFSKTGRGHGTDRAIVGGLLGLAPDDDAVRTAMELAREQGRDIRVLFSDEEPDHPNTARIAAEGRQGQRVEMVGASIGGGSIEVREINGMEVSFGCEYPTLLVFHRDLPGVVGTVTSALGRHGVNIAFMRVFRHAKREDACMVIETDGQIPRALIRQLPRESPEITEVCTL